MNAAGAGKVRDYGSVLPMVLAGVSQMDDDHDQLFAGMARLARKLEMASFDEARRCAERLLIDIESHFAFEELVMTRIVYPDIARHREQHEKHMVAAGAVVRELAACRNAEGLRLHSSRLLGRLGALREEIENHTRGADEALIAYVQSRQEAHDGIAA